MSKKQDTQNNEPVVLVPSPPLEASPSRAQTMREEAQERVTATLREHKENGRMSGRLDGGGMKVWGSPQEWNQHLHDSAVAAGRRPNVPHVDLGHGMVISKDPPELAQLPEVNPNAPEAEQEAVRRAREASGETRTGPAVSSMIQAIKAS